MKLTGTDSVDLALDLDHTVLTSKQVNGMVDLGVLDQDMFRVIVIFLACRVRHVKHLVVARRNRLISLLTTIHLVPSSLVSAGRF